MAVRMRQLDSHWKDFRKISYLILFRKSIQKIQVKLKSEKNNGHFTGIPTNIYDTISLTYSQTEKCCRQKLYRKSEHPFYLEIR